MNYHEITVNKPITYYRLPNETFKIEYSGMEEEMNLQSKSITIEQNGTQIITPDENYQGLENVTINTNVQPPLETKSLNLTQPGQQTITPSEGYYGIGSLYLTYSEYELQERNIDITENGQYEITPTNEYGGLKKVNLNCNVQNVQTTPSDEFYIQEVKINNANNYIKINNINAYLIPLTTTTAIEKGILIQIQSNQIKKVYMYNTQPDTINGQTGWYLATNDPTNYITPDNQNITFYTTENQIYIQNELTTRVEYNKIEYPDNYLNIINLIN